VRVKEERRGIYREREERESRENRHGEKETLTEKATEERK
jgi:hypothetical protein